MFKMVWLCFIALFSSQLIATDLHLLPVHVNIQDKASLQRGAKFFMNYCSGCHTLRYMRYNRMAVDLGLTTFNGEIDTDLLKNNLIFTEAKIQDPIENSMPKADALQWFGRLPPDLSLSAREHGPAWLYTYLKSFYTDKKRPFGANNLLVPDVGMPNVLEPLIGKMILNTNNHDANTHDTLQLILTKAGEMTQGEFNSALEDLVTFLVYVGEPAKLVRYHIGWAVLVFLIIFLIVAYQLKKTYWKKLT